MEKTDAASSEEVKRMVQDLATTIQRTLSESPQITLCLNRVRAEGYEVSVVVEATVGFSRVGPRETAETPAFDFRVERNAVHVVVPRTSTAATYAATCAAVGGAAAGVLHQHDAGHAVLGGGAAR